MGVGGSHRQQRKPWLEAGLSDEDEQSGCGQGVPQTQTALDAGGFHQSGRRQRRAQRRALPPRQQSLEPKPAAEF